MSTGAKVATAIIVLYLMFAAAAVFAVQQVVAHSGVVTVSVHEHGVGGTRFNVPLPASLANAGIRMAIASMPPHEKARVREELARVGPVLLAIVDELESRDDFTLVRVESDFEQVLVAKRGGALVVDVRSPDADVRLSLPVDTLRLALSALEQ